MSNPEIKDRATVKVEILASQRTGLLDQLTDALVENSLSVQKLLMAERSLSELKKEHAELKASSSLQEQSHPSNTLEVVIEENNSLKQQLLLKAKEVDALSEDVNLLKAKLGSDLIEGGYNLSEILSENTSLREKNRLLKDELDALSKEKSHPPINNALKEIPVDELPDEPDDDGGMMTEDELFESFMESNTEEKPKN